MLPRQSSTALVLCVALVAAAVLGGCTPKAQSASPGAVSGAQADTGAPAAAAKLELMTPDYKYSYIATDFPVQVPVPNGNVERGVAQSPSAWDYVIVVPGSVASVKQWYREAYGRAEWTVVKESANMLSFNKGGAQSEARFEPATSDTTRVTVVLGVGTPVLDTQ